MGKSTIMKKVDAFLSIKGITPKEYTWSLQGPTLIYLGEVNPFKKLSVGDVGNIKSIGAKFLVEP